MTLFWQEISVDEWSCWCSTVNRNTIGRWVAYVHYAVHGEHYSLRLPASDTSDQAMAKAAGIIRKISGKAADGYALIACETIF